MKLLKLGYSIVTYLFFLTVFSYLVLFLGGGFLKDWLTFLPPLKTVDAGTAYFHWKALPAWLNNLILLLAFSVHHSVMARSGMKAWLIKMIPASSERSTFVLATCCLLSWMYLAWQPQPQTVWQLQGAAAMTMALLFLLGSGLVLWSTFMISHAQLFGLAQAWQDFKGQTANADDDDFRTPALYKYSRHPMYVGVLIVIWCTPQMTNGQLLLAAVWSIYVLVGIYFEERDLVRHFGTQYVNYQASVSKLIPFKAVANLLGGNRGNDN